MTNPIDHVSTVRGLLLSQYRTSPRFQAILDLYASMCNDVELLWQQVAKLLSIDEVGGVNLDRIGWLVQASRYVAGPMTLGDSDYRRVLKLAIRRNMSKGKLEDFIGALAEFFGISSGIIVVTDARMTPGMSISIAIPIAPPTGVDLAVLDTGAKPGGPYTPSLWPRAMAAGISSRTYYQPGAHFGFLESDGITHTPPGSLGFATESPFTAPGGVFAESF
jgi:Protein of unknown function (DUF2612).